MSPYVLNFLPCIGCYDAVFCVENKCHVLDNNTVGNCYLQCKSKNYFEGGCDGNYFFFGLQVRLCRKQLFYNDSRKKKNPINYKFS